MTMKEKDLTVAPNQSKQTVSVEIETDSSSTSTSTATSTPVANNSRVSFDVKSAERPAFELRLLGMRYEAAMKALERQLDLCAIYNFKSFSIIHGKGNGILQDGVHKILGKFWHILYIFMFYILAN